MVHIIVKDKMLILKILILCVVICMLLCLYQKLKYQKDISDDEKKQIAEKYGLDAPKEKKSSNVSVDVGMAIDVTKLVLFQEGEKEVLLTEEKEIEEFLIALNFDKWKGVKDWDLKVLPSKYFLLDDKIIIGIIEDEGTCYIKVEQELSEESKNSYKYYEVPKSVVEFFRKYYK